MVRFNANSHELRQLMIAHNPETVYFSGAPALQTGHRMGRRIWL